jgi:hypothetical protein
MKNKLNKLKYKWVLDNPDKVKVAQRKWNQKRRQEIKKNPEKYADYLEKHRNYQKEYHRKYRKLNAEKFRKYWRDFQKSKYYEYKVKIKARDELHHAVKTGDIVKPKICKLCPNTTVQAHHPDYSKPLKVIWLCLSCHRKIHRLIK